MNATPSRPLAVLLTALASTACASTFEGTPSASPESAAPRILQPGAPGEASRGFEGGPLETIEGKGHTDADVRFMRGMIPHHAQALQMTALVAERTENDGLRRMALRMQISQTDEIGLMQRWLAERGEEAPDGDPDSGVPLMMMPGMLSPEQMRQLTDASGVDFERFFLEFMIQHHSGAIVMVEELFSSPGAGQESTINFFASEVDSDQTIEIRRMRQMLEDRGNDEYGHSAGVR